MRFESDVDIDFGDRSRILALISHTPAAMRKKNPPRRHITGIYVTDIPQDHLHGVAAIDYSEAETRGYIKLDFLNVHVYGYVRDQSHLTALLEEPDWTLLRRQDIVQQLVHIHSHYELLQSMPEPVNSIPRLAMFLALIRPSKVHLVGQSWAEIAKTIWDKAEDGTYTFKKGHAVAYAHLVVIHLNLLEEYHRATGNYKLPPPISTD